MKKIVTALTLLATLWLITSASAGSRLSLFDHTFVTEEFSSIETDTTLDGRVLRVKYTKEPAKIPCDSPNGECAARCENAYDDDNDGLVDYPRDPGCDSYADEDEWNMAPPPPPPPAPPPPPPAPPPPPPEWQWTLLEATPPDYQEWGGDECGWSQIPCSLDDVKVIRCKVYTFVLKPHEGHFGIDFGPALKYEGRWRVCYRPYGGGITDVTYRIGDATDTYGQWEWRGNDSGYPYHIREAHRVYIYYGGGAAICIGGGYGCGPERHFRLTYTFTDTGRYGTITKVTNYL